MDKKVEILKKETVFKKFIFKIDEAQLRHERYDGRMSEPLTRLSLNRGDSVAAVLHNQQNDTIILTEQFRYPSYEKGNGWLLELPAGSVDGDEDPQKAMERELVEEIGYEVKSLQHISTFYPSPGGSSERIFLYYASVLPKHQTSEGGGVAGEGEDILTVIMPVQQAMSKIESGDIMDSKAIIGLQWLRANLQK